MNVDGIITSHWHNCETTGGLRHYRCAVERIRVLDAELAEANRMLDWIQENAACLRSRADGRTNILCWPADSLRKSLRREIQRTKEIDQ